MKAAQESTILIENPLAGEELLVETMYGSPRPTPAPRRPHAVVSRPAQPKPSHYKIVSISLYNEDIERLDRMVADLKKRGHYKANKSQLIRYALAQLDTATIPKDALEP